jgi:uncharacterized protein DUF3617
MARAMAALHLGILAALVGTTCGTAHAADFPPRKTGLWEIEMTMPGGPMPPRHAKMCLDASTDAQMQELATEAGKGMCNPPQIVRNGSTVTVDSVCKMGPSQMTTQAVTQFSGDTSYHTDITTKFEPPTAGHDSQTMVQDAKWVGPCPADLQPGDVVMGNGMKMNFKQMIGGHP